MLIAAELTLVVGWLNSFNAYLSPKRCWREPRSQEVGGGGGVGGVRKETIPNAVHRMTPVLRWVRTGAILMFHSL